MEREDPDPDAFRHRLPIPRTETSDTRYDRYEREKDEKDATLSLFQDKIHHYSRSRFVSNEEGYLWFRCEHRNSNTDTWTWTRLSDVRDASNNMVMRKWHADASGRRTVRRISPIEKNGLLVRSNGHEIALFRVGQELFAVDRACPHRGGPLHLGDIEDLGDEGGFKRKICVVCPWHKWTFDLHNGSNVVPNVESMTVKVYPVRLEFQHLGPTSSPKKKIDRTDEISKLRLSFKRAEAEFQRAAVASSPRTVNEADLKLRSAKAALQRYMDHEEIRDVGLRDDVSEDEQRCTAESDDNVEGTGDSDSWIFRRHADWDEKRSMTSRIEGINDEPIAIHEKDEDPMIVIGFASIDSGVFSRTDF